MAPHLYLLYFQNNEKCICLAPHCVGDFCKPIHTPYVVRLPKLFTIIIFSLTAVQEERGPRNPKLLKRNNKSEMDLRKKLSTHYGDLPFSTPNVQKLQHQILAKILISCLKQSRQNENFRHLHRKQQNSILKHVWSECFVLKAAYWSIDIGNIVEGYVKMCIIHIRVN